MQMFLRALFQFVKHFLVFWFLAHASHTITFVKYYCPLKKIKMWERKR